MAYDLSGKYSTFDGATKDVRHVLEVGALSETLILGLPFYGRDPNQSERTMPYRNIPAKSHSTPDTNEVDGLYFNGARHPSSKDQRKTTKGTKGYNLKATC